MVVNDGVRCAVVLESFHYMRLTSVFTANRSSWQDFTTARPPSLNLRKCWWQFGKFGFEDAARVNPFVVLPLKEAGRYNDYGLAAACRVRFVASEIPGHTN